MFEMVLVEDFSPFVSFDEGLEISRLVLEDELVDLIPEVLVLKNGLEVIF